MCCSYTFALLIELHSHRVSFPSPQLSESGRFDRGKNRCAGGDSQFFGGGADYFGYEGFAVGVEHHAGSSLGFEEFHHFAFEQVAGADRFGVVFEEDDVAR